MELPVIYKTKVVDALKNERERYDITLKEFCRKMGINQGSYSRLINGEIEGVVSNKELLRIGRDLGVKAKESNWTTARTRVYDEMEESLMFSKQFNKSFILVDDSGVGKTHCAKHIISGMKNAFYLDCSEAKTPQLFTRELGRIVGIDNRGRFVDVKRDLKYTLNSIQDPIVVLDDAGYLDAKTFIEIIEYWNGTEGNCAWYMIGDDALEQKIEKGISSKKPGFRAVFNRFNESYSHIVPAGKDDRRDFLMELINDVATLNLPEDADVMPYVKACIVTDRDKNAEHKLLRTLKTMIERHA